MKTPVYNQKGEKTGTALLPKELFEKEINRDLLHQVVVSQRANRRRVLAQTKDRSEVRGGGRKPWRQKGTGRARHGSIRSPIWKGGGVTFGPRKEKKFKKEIPQKIKRKALKIALSSKVKSGSLIVLDQLKLKKRKTKLMEEILNELPLKEKNCLIALSEVDKDVILSARNIKGVEVMEARNLTALDLLSFKYLLLPKKSIKILKRTLS